MTPTVKEKNRRLICENKQQPLGSLITSLGKRRSLRVAKKMNRTLSKIWICNDVLMDIIPFFVRSQIGLKLALLSPRFNALVDKHFNGKSELTIWRRFNIYKRIGKPKFSVFVDNSCTNSVQFPLHNNSLRNKIRFKDLWISYVNHSVIAFLRSNQQIFDGKGTKLDLNVFSSSKPKDVQRICNVFVRGLWPIFAPNIRHLGFRNAEHLHNLLLLTSPTVLTDLNHLNSIASVQLFPEVILDENLSNATSAGQALFKWLHTPRKDGKPKQLRCSVYFDEFRIKKWVNNFEEAFLRATICANYILSLIVHAAAEIMPFELVNERTREKLTLEEGGDFWNGRQWVMKRCQNGQMVHWEDESADNLNNVMINLCSVNCIGPLSAPAAGQRNGKGRRIVRK